MAWWEKGGGWGVVMWTDWVGGGWFRNHPIMLANTKPLNSLKLTSSNLPFNIKALKLCCVLCEWDEIKFFVFCYFRPQWKSTWDKNLKSAIHFTISCFMFFLLFFFTILLLFFSTMFHVTFSDSHVWQLGTWLVLLLVLVLWSINRIQIMRAMILSLF